MRDLAFSPLGLVYFWVLSGVRYRVWGMGRGAWALVSGVWGLGFGVWGLGLRIQGNGFRGVLSLWSLV